MSSKFYPIQDTASIADLVVDVADLVTLSGVAANQPDFGSFTGGVIPNDSTCKEALQALETRIELNETANWNVITSTTAFTAGTSLVIPLSSTYRHYRILIQGMHGNSASYLQLQGVINAISSYKLSYNSDTNAGGIITQGYVSIFSSSFNEDDTCDAIIDIDSLLSTRPTRINVQSTYTATGGTVNKFLNVCAITSTSLAEATSFTLNSTAANWSGSQGTYRVLAY
jgi:hypothetical protein